MPLDDTIPTENGIYSLIHTASLPPFGINTVSKYVLPLVDGLYSQL